MSDAWLGLREPAPLAPLRRGRVAAKDAQARRSDGGTTEQSFKATKVISELVFHLGTLPLPRLPSRHPLAIAELLKNEQKWLQSPCPKQLMN